MGSYIRYSTPLFGYGSRVTQTNLNLMRSVIANGADDSAERVKFLEKSQQQTILLTPNIRNMLPNFLMDITNFINSVNSGLNTVPTDAMTNAMTNANTIALQIERTKTQLINTFETAIRPLQNNIPSLTSIINNIQTNLRQLSSDNKTTTYNIIYQSLNDVKSIVKNLINTPYTFENVIYMVNDFIQTDVPLNKLNKQLNDIQTVANDVSKQSDNVTNKKMLSDLSSYISNHNETTITGIKTKLSDIISPQLQIAETPQLVESKIFSLGMFDTLSSNRVIVNNIVKYIDLYRTYVISLSRTQPNTNTMIPLVQYVNTIANDKTNTLDDTVRQQLLNYVNGNTNQSTFEQYITSLLFDLNRKLSQAALQNNNDQFAANSNAKNGQYSSLTQTVLNTQPNVISVASLLR